ncbi:MAG: hypothetical protein JJW01_02625 [Alphaproteobacteria bacterium]|nr:hypothetical protein [Rickettsiales bacterium]
MPQLDFGFYLSQMLSFFGLFGIFSLITFFLVYPRIENLLKKRESFITTQLSEIEKIASMAEEVRLELTKQKLALRRRLDELAMNYRIRANTEFSKITNQANDNFELAIVSGRNIIEKELADYQKRLDSLVDLLSDSILTSVDFQTPLDYDVVTFNNAQS